MGGVCSEAIESQNVVGYSSKDTVEQNNFMTISFSNVGFNTCDIQQIKLSDGGAGSIGWGTENFSIWEGAPTTVEGSEFAYLDPSYDLTGEATDYYWGNPNTGDKAKFSIAAGQAFVIECAEGIQMTTAGEVPTTIAPFTTCEQNNFFGNPYPAAIDIQAIAIDDGGAGSIGWGTENFSVWEGTPTTVEGSEFAYLDPSYDLSGEATGYYWGNPNTGDKAKFSIAPGQGVVVECAGGLKITIAPPYSL